MWPDKIVCCLLRSKGGVGHHPSTHSRFACHTSRSVHSPHIRILSCLAAVSSSDSDPRLPIVVDLSSKRQFCSTFVDTFLPTLVEMSRRSSGELSCNLLLTSSLIVLSWTIYQLSSAMPAHIVEVPTPERPSILPSTFIDIVMELDGRSAQFMCPIPQSFCFCVEIYQFLYIVMLA
jgi:hypothetical protein